MSGFPSSLKILAELATQFTFWYNPYYQLSWNCVISGCLCSSPHLSPHPSLQFTAGLLFSFRLLGWLP